MSLKAITWAFGLEDERLTSAQLPVLLALADAAYEDQNYECTVKHATLAKKARVSVDTTQRRVKELCALGLVHVIKQRGECGRLIASRYIVLVDEAARRHASAQGWAGEIEPLADEEIEATDRSLERTDHDESDPSKPQVAAWSRPQMSGNQAATETEPSRTAAATEQTLTNINNPPLPPLRGEGEGEKASLSETANGDRSENLRRCGSREVDEDGARLARWEKFRRAWPWDATEKPEEARRRFMELENGEQLAAVATAARYIDACVQRERKISHAKNWISGKGWQVFDAPAQSASARIEAERQRLAEAKAKAHEIQRQKYGGIIIRKGTPQAAAWARHDGEPLKYRRVGAWEDAIVKPSEWPPPASGQSARDGPGEAGARA